MKNKSWADKSHRAGPQDEAQRYNCQNGSRSVHKQGLRAAQNMERWAQIICVWPPAPARGNFHVNSGLLSLLFSGILHNTQYGQFPPQFIGNEISKIFIKVKQTNKYEVDKNFPCPVMWRCPQVTHIDTFHMIIYICNIPWSQVTSKQSLDQMWSRKERSRV